MIFTSTTTPWDVGMYAVFPMNSEGVAVFMPLFYLNDPELARGKGFTTVRINVLAKLT